MDFLDNKILITGDLHGDFKKIRYICKECQTSKEDTLIILGDCGFNYFLNKRDEELKEKISEYPITIFAVRGNHELRPEKMKNEWHYEYYFFGLVIVEDKYPNIKYAIDGRSYCFPWILKEEELFFYRFFVIGGAYSPDKDIRIKNNWSWFEDEQLNKEEREEIIKNLNWLYDNKAKGPVDIFLSHTCPLKYEPKELFFPETDQSKVDKSMEKFLDEIESKYDYKFWFFGHFHGDKKINSFDKNKEQFLLFNEVLDLKEFLKTKNYNKSILCKYYG